ncbi:Fur family transcriptional regulator [Streptococcus caprae]|uniref:Fur family transcriptional regulator n=1 Tax=Streptococcus caprae TaxID=1640501 RepID=A0ABV8CUJ6_9STRE
MGHHHEHHRSSDAFDYVISHLKAKHIRITETRKAVIQYMIASFEHPSAEQIYKDLKPTYPNISLATVYNNLKVLIEEGFVTELKVSQDNTSYFDFMGHDHLNVVCEQCGKITDIDHHDIEDISKVAAEETGYEITSAQLMLYGICPECQANK